MKFRRPRRRRIPRSIRFPRRARALAWIALAASASIGLVGYDHWSRRATGGDVSRYHDRTFRVVRVIDGDTLDIDCPDDGDTTTRIRLWGIDTPEVGLGNTRAMYFGEEAQDFAEHRLYQRDVHLVLVGERTRDKYGRLLAYVFLQRGGPMFNELILEEGYAYADRRFEHPWRRNFEALEIRARRQQAGLWSGVRIDDMPPWRQRLERGKE